MFLFLFLFLFSFICAADDVDQRYAPQQRAQLHDWQGLMSGEGEVPYMERSNVPEQIEKLREWQQIEKSMILNNKALFDATLEMAQSVDMVYNFGHGFVNLLTVACQNKKEHTSYFVEQLIKKGLSAHEAPSVKIRSLDGDERIIVSGLGNPLDVAVLCGNVSAVRTLLAYNVDPNRSEFQHNFNLFFGLVLEVRCKPVFHSKVLKVLSPDASSPHATLAHNKEDLDEIIQLLQRKMDEKELLDNEFADYGLALPCSIQ